MSVPTDSFVRHERFSLTPRRTRLVRHYISGVWFWVVMWYYMSLYYLHYFWRLDFPLPFEKSLRYFDDLKRPPPEPQGMDCQPPQETNTDKDNKLSLRDKKFYSEP